MGRDNTRVPEIFIISLLLPSDQDEVLFGYEVTHLQILKSSQNGQYN